MGPKNELAALLWSALLLTSWTGTVHAQDATPQDPEWNDDPWGYTAPPPEDPPPTSELPEKTIVKRKFQWSMNIGVPLWLNVPKDVVRPGADLSWVGGVDIGYLVFGAGVGVMWTPIDLRNFTDENGNTGSDQSPTTRLYFFPEMRVQVPNKSLVLPYLTGAFDVNWWHFKEVGLTCGFWFCGTSRVFRFSPGFTGKVGLAFEIKRGVMVDLGMKYSLTGPGSFFEERRWWLTPYVGVLVRRRQR